MESANVCGIVTRSRRCLLLSFALLFVYSFCSTLYAQSYIREHKGTRLAENFGQAVAGVGDLNGDGKPEYAVGSPYYKVSGISVGKVTIYDGGTGHKLWEDYGATAGDRFGFSVAGDGSRIVVGAPAKMTLCTCSAQSCDRTQGYVRIYDASPIRTLVAQVGRTILGAGNGFSVDVVGDIVQANGSPGQDGISEIVTGAPYDGLDYFNYYTIGPCGFHPEGRVFLLNGANGDTITSKPGGKYGFKFGTAVAGLGDINGDGVRDFGGVGGGTTTQSELPELVIYSGVGSQYAKLHSRVVGSPWQYGPTSLSGISSVDQDNCADILLGESSSDRVRIISGACQNFTDIGVVYGPPARQSTGFGWSVAATGDVNNDQHPDFLAGENSYSYNGPGQAHVISGATLGIIASLQVGVGEDDAFGYCVAGLKGDLNADSTPDYIIGAPVRHNYSGDGSAFVYNGPMEPEDTGAFHLIKQPNGTYTVVFF
jgi:hypothetical protein